jgi:glycosyltransferase involved in cell wall biosynthesis
MTGTQLHLLSFEGPDPYSRAGGIASRISGLSEALAGAGFETHLWFVGDPDLPGVEQRGRLTLHRWCQWISRYHPEGVYAGEEGKRQDYARSLPPSLLHEFLLPHILHNGGRAAVLAEEWQTADAVLHLDWLLRRENVRDRVTILWNANNTFGFDRIDWQRLAEAATITTVSRYMRQLIWPMGVDARVIPNGLSEEALGSPERVAAAHFQRCFHERTVLAKVARWDPDKRWTLAIDTLAEMKRRGFRPLLIARGGIEPHGREVLEHARHQGLHVIDRRSATPGPRGLFEALANINGADVVNLRSHLDPEGRRLLFGASAAVLANSGHEPFGLVGLEAMASGGLACTGSTGEDYAVPGQNALVLETADPREFVGLFQAVQADPDHERAIRRAGQLTAEQYTWPSVVARVLLPRIRQISESQLPHQP